MGKEEEEEEWYNSRVIGSFRTSAERRMSNPRLLWKWRGGEEEEGVRIVVRIVLLSPPDLFSET